MRLLLDTHALIWWAQSPGKLPRKTYDTIEGAEDVLVSTVSAYEILLKFSLGKLPIVESLVCDLGGYLESQQFASLPMTLAHAELAGRLPLFHRDPFDRLLVAQAMTEDMTLVSNEALFDGFGVRRLW